MSRKRQGNKSFDNLHSADPWARLIAGIGIILTCGSIMLAIKSGENAKVAQQPDVIGYFCISKTLDFKKEFKGEPEIENCFVADDSYFYELKRSAQDCNKLSPATRFLWLILHNVGRGRTERFHVVSIDYHFVDDRHVADYPAKTRFEYIECRGALKRVKVIFESQRMATIPSIVRENRSVVLLMESFVPIDSDGQTISAEKYIEQMEFEGFGIESEFFDVYSLHERNKPNTLWRRFRRFLRLVESDKPTPWPITVDVTNRWPWL